MFRNRRIPRVVWFAVVLFVVVTAGAVWFFHLGPGRTVGMEALAADSSYSNRVVRVHATNVAPSELLPAHASSQISDDGRTWLPVVGPQEIVRSGAYIRTIVHRVPVLGQERVVLEHTGLSLQLVAREFIASLGFAPGDAAVSACTPTEFAGAVAEETAVLGANAMAVQSQGRSVYVIVPGDVPPVGTIVSGTAQPAAELAFLDEPQYLFADDVRVSLESVVGQAATFGEKTITVRGDNIGAVSAWGRSAFTIADDEGTELIVIANLDAPVEGQTVNVTGRVQHLTVFGKTLCLCLAAEKVDVVVATPESPPANGNDC